MLLAVVVASLGSAAWVRYHPERSFDAGFGIGVERHVGQTVWTAIEHGHNRQPGAVKIESLEPQFMNDGAAVEVVYIICQLDSEVLAANGVGAFGYGATDADVEEYCEDTWPAIGGVISLGSEPRQDLLVGVTATQPGRTVIDHHLIRFAEGWQRGTDDIRARIELTAS